MLYSPTFMAWFYLLIAGMFEICWAVGIEYIGGFKFNFSLLLILISMGLSMLFLGMSIKIIPMSIAYAIWSGIGIVGVIVYGIIFLNEPISLMKTIFVGFILIGIIGIQLTT